MKKYFVRYLPVEGQIKEGYCITDKNEIIYYNGNYGEVFPNTLKPVKLYLCSRDIQPGDKLLCFKPDMSSHLEVELLMIITNGKITAYNVNSTEFGEFGVLSKNCYKVIREAVNMNEGDEFEENELC